MIKCPECSGIKPSILEVSTTTVERGLYTERENVIYLEPGYTPGSRLASTSFRYELHCRACQHVWPVPNHLTVEIS